MQRNRSIYRKSGHSYLTGPFRVIDHVVIRVPPDADKINNKSEYQVDPVLKAAIDNPRFAGAYGSDPADIGYNNHLGGFAVATDSYMKARIRRWDGRAANDNSANSRRDYRAGQH